MNDVLVTLPADGNAIDETGYIWTFLEEAPDPERIHPGAVIVAGDADAPFMARVVDLVDKPAGTIVHLEIVGVPSSSTSCVTPATCPTDLTSRPAAPR